MMTLRGHWMSQRDRVRWAANPHARRAMWAVAICAIAVVMVLAWRAVCGVVPPPGLGRPAITTPYGDYVTITGRYPHATTSFTQGFFFHEGRLYESVGQYGSSALHAHAQPPAGAVDVLRRFSQSVFAEGACVFQGRMYVLTWRERTAYVLNPQTHQIEKTLPYARQGWGLTTDGESLMASDGSATIYIMDGELHDQRSIRVTHGGKPVTGLNELEFIEGYIWANVFTTNTIVVIDPRDGRVVRALDFSGIYKHRPGDNHDGESVMNGIAYDPHTKTVYLTGKRWRSIITAVVKPGLGR